MHKSRGMTLLSILIAMGLFGVLLLGIMSAMTLMNKSERNFRQDSETTMLVENINAMLKDSTACVNTFAKPAGSEKNPNAAGVAFSPIMNKANVEAFKTGNTYGAGNVIKITQMKISNFTPANTAEGIADLDIEITKEGPQGIGPKVLKRQIKIFAILFDATGNGKIKFCQALGESQIWQYASNGTDIFYSGGKVGIGTNNPQKALHVIGTVNESIRVENTSNNARIEFKDSGTGANLPEIGSSANALTMYTGGGERLRIEVDGTVNVIGAFTAAAYGPPASDISKKKDIHTLESSLDNLSRIQGVSFLWKKKAELPFTQDTRKNFGFIAQEVEKVYPELVRGKEGNKTINFMGFTAILWEAVKELQQIFKTENEETKRRIQILEQQIEELKTEHRKQKTSK
ncbi:MAG: hypothetical protein A3D92_07055 [Bacteroidetes bacterium RIFCSPHIGHO2_02_FULL_44_7]|nr:MAG: hypothetical protein A3D92_07055 [Bacteroidetes bacterium RIFCSPHIGHO2_02_FULL_44_7]